MYVKHVKKSSKWSYTSLLITFLIFNQFPIQKVLESWVSGLSNHTIKCYVNMLKVEISFDTFNINMVGKPWVSAFQNFFWIENQLNNKKVMSKDV